MPKKRWGDSPRNLQVLLLVRAMGTRSVWYKRVRAISTGSEKPRVDVIGVLGALVLNWLSRKLAM
jgi:hypothetical protein